MAGMTDLSHLAVPGATFALRVTPRARQQGIDLAEDGRLTARVNAPPVDGKANDAVRSLLARALGVAPGRLVLIRGQTARDKVFRLD